ncbi:hypothetical protein ACIQ9E_01485 [Streptomyces sp. NPDC094448]|uniref:hypothetical protein n=1 Tax=Streptomyces sp. NPDC094448 TaxID=3366063 RepID=UPI00380FEEA4
MRHRRVSAAPAAAGVLAVSGCSAASGDGNDKPAAAHDGKAAAAPAPGWAGARYASEPAPAGAEAGAGPDRD